MSEERFEKEMTMEERETRMSVAGKVETEEERKLANRKVCIGTEKIAAPTPGTAEGGGR